VNSSAMSRVEAYLQANTGGQTVAAITLALSGLTKKQVAVALRGLCKVGRAHCVELKGNHFEYHAGPFRVASIARPDRSNKMDGHYAPPQWSNEVARPGGEDHKRFGSLQADGTVKPYHSPRFGCTGILKDTTNNARDA
jgi:hypothetical protein